MRRVLDSPVTVIIIDLESTSPLALDSPTDATVVCISSCVGSSLTDCRCRYSPPGLLHPHRSAGPSVSVSRPTRHPFCGGPRVVVCVFLLKTVSVGGPNLAEGKNLGQVKRKFFFDFDFVRCFDSINYYRGRIMKK